jgi:hypothetical protein
MDNKNQRAFPVPCVANENGIYTTLDAPGGIFLAGLTKREMLAGMAMQGLIAGKWACPDNTNASPEYNAPIAVAHADALLAELSK